MAIKGIGINAHSELLNGSLEMLERTLAHFQCLGFDYVEIPVDGVGAILNGRLNLKHVKRVKEALAKFPLKYTVHSPGFLNLMDINDLLMHRSIFEASIEFAGEIGAEILVYHSGRIELRDEYLGEVVLTRELLTLPDRALVSELEREERETLAELAELAEGLGVTIGVENRDPMIEEGALWELARRMRQKSIDLTYRIAPHGDIGHYNYGGMIDRLVEQVKGVGKDNVGITLDFGHAYVASRYYGFDFLEAIELAMPLVKHIHIGDNFGKPAGLDRRHTVLAPGGKGCLHLPIGWGEIPYRKIFSCLKSYEGIILLDIHPRYRDYYGDALQETRRLLEECGVE